MKSLSEIRDDQNWSFFRFHFLVSVFCVNVPSCVTLPRLFSLPILKSSQDQCSATAQSTIDDPSSQFEKRIGQERRWIKHCVQRPSSNSRGYSVTPPLSHWINTSRTGPATHAPPQSTTSRCWVITHPIGYHGHGTGPTIGLWDQQGGVPGRGDYPLNANTAHSIELNARVMIPEWDNQEIRIMLEEDAFFDGESVWYIDGRQTEIILIPRVSRINTQ